MTIERINIVSQGKNIKIIQILILQVDELLVGIVKQIRLSSQRLLTHSKRKRKKKCSSDIADISCVQSAARGVIGRIFKKSPSVDSCDNLLVI